MMQRPNGPAQHPDEGDRFDEERLNMAKTRASLAAEEALRRLLLGDEIEDRDERRRLTMAAFGSAEPKLPDMWQQEQAPSADKEVILRYLLGDLSPDKEAEVFLLTIHFDNWANAAREVLAENRPAIRTRFAGRPPDHGKV